MTRYRRIRMPRTLVSCQTFNNIIDQLLQIDADEQRLREQRAAELAADPTGEKHAKSVTSRWLSQVKGRHCITVKHGKVNEKTGEATDLVDVRVLDASPVRVRDEWWLEILAEDQQGNTYLVQAPNKRITYSRYR